MGGQEWGEVGLCAYIWSCNLEKEQFCFELWHNQYTGWMLTLDGSLAHSNIAIWLPGKGCCGRSCCAFDSSLSQGSSSLMNARSFLMTQKLSLRAIFEENKKTDVLILAWTIAAQGYTRKELFSSTPHPHPPKKKALTDFTKKQFCLTTSKVIKQLQPKKSHG